MLDSYFAGLLDAEGSIMLLNRGRGRSRRPQIAISLAERHVLEDVQNEYGGFISDLGKVPQWRLNGSPALEALARARPHLVIERRRKLAALLLDDPIIPRTDMTGRNGSKIGHNERVFQAMRAANAIRLSAPPNLKARKPTAEDVGYLAGILDGEGHISAPSRRVEVWSTDPELPAWLKSRFGGNTHVGHKARGNQRATWRWLSSVAHLKEVAAAADLMRLDRKADELRRLGRLGC